MTREQRAGSRRPGTHRVGAHRSGSVTSWPRWAILLGALAVSIVLTAVGLFLLDRLRVEPVPVPTTAQPSVVADPGQIDPALDASITVLDGTGQPAVAAGVGQALSDAGWDVVATASATEVGDRTVVWFDEPALEPIARGLVQQLGVGEARQSDGRISGSPITIVLGTDAPGAVPSTEPSDDGEIEHSPTPSAP
jgi:LytR cell envelope-related transcriptional attenuator